MESSSKERSKAAKKNIRKMREYAKEQLLLNGGWSVLPNVVFKEVIPRIISEAYDKHTQEQSESLIYRT